MPAPNVTISISIDTLTTGYYLIYTAHNNTTEDSVVTKQYFTTNTALGAFLESQIVVDTT